MMTFILNVLIEMLAAGLWFYIGYRIGYNRGCDKGCKDKRNYWRGATRR